MYSGGNFQARLSPEELTGLERLGRPVEYEADACLMNKGEHGDCVIVLHTGLVKIISYDADGGVRLLGLRGPGELLGEIACLDGGPRSVTVVAANRVAGIKITRGRFLDYLEEFPRVAREVTRQVSGRLRTAEGHHMALIADSNTRVSRVLADLAELFAPGRRHAVTIPLNQGEIAQLAAVSLVSAQRSLRKLRDLALVETGYRSIVLPCARCLRRAAASALNPKSIRRCSGDPGCPSS